MPKGVEVKNLNKALKIIKELRVEIEENIIATGLDKTVTIELKQLKTEMLYIINTGAKSKITLQKDDFFEELKIAKVDVEMIKFLRNVDLENVSQTKGYNSLVQGGVSVVSSKRLKKAVSDMLGAKPTSPMSSGVNVRIPMSESATLESHLSRATKYFNSALFVLVDERGISRYYFNPGIDLSKYVKVVCSNTPGNSERAQQVFDRHKTGARPGNRQDSKRTPNDYADYSLLQSGLELVKDKFVDLTEVIEKLKYGEYEEAKYILTGKRTMSPNLEEVLNKIELYKKGKQLAPSTKAYRNVVEILKNLELKKTKQKGRTYYTLVTRFDPNAEGTSEVQETLAKQVKLWKISSKDKWVETLVKKKLKIIQKLMR